MREQIKEQLKELPNTGYGQALGIYLEEEINKLNELSNIDLPAEEITIEVKARQRAIKVLRNVMGLVVKRPKIIVRNQYK